MYVCIKALGIRDWPLNNIAYWSLCTQLIGMCGWSSEVVRSVRL